MSESRLYDFIVDILRQARGWEPRDQNDAVLAAQQVTDVADALMPIITDAITAGVAAMQQRPGDGK